MSSRKNSTRYQSMVNSSMAASIVGTETNISYGDNVGVQFVWTGTAPVGVGGMEASNDNGLTWTPMTFSPSPAITGNSGNLLLSANNVPYQKVRPVYTRTSGVGTLQAYVTVKES